MLIPGTALPRSSEPLGQVERSRPAPGSGLQQDPAPRAACGGCSTSETPGGLFVGAQPQQGQSQPNRQPPLLAHSPPGPSSGEHTAHCSPVPSSWPSLLAPQLFHGKNKARRLLGEHPEGGKEKRPLTRSSLPSLRRMWGSSATLGLVPAATPWLGAEVGAEKPGGNVNRRVLG